MSPLLAPPELLRKLPPTYIEVCSMDPVGPAASAYAKKLEDCSVPTKLFVLDGIPHGGHMMFPGADFSNAAREAVAKGVIWSLDQKASQ